MCSEKFGDGSVTTAAAQGFWHCLGTPTTDERVPAAQPTLSTDYNVIFSPQQALPAPELCDLTEP